MTVTLSAQQILFNSRAPDRGHRRRAWRALDVALGRHGRVTIGEDGGLQVEKAADLPPFAGALPQGQPAASIVVSAASLRAAVEGQEGFVRLSIYGEEEMLELSGGGKYALVMAVSGVQEWWFWHARSGARANRF